MQALGVELIELAGPAQGLGVMEIEDGAAVGLDFGFGFPAWWARRFGSARAVWEAARDHGEEWLRDCDPPFWGRPGRRRPAGEQLRRAELGTGAKSMFQIGGAGTVGTGSVRGMPYLLRLADAGFSIWPFEDHGGPVAIEIYPRTFARGVRKRRMDERRAHLERSGDSPLLTRAAVSEDAFDAAVSAIAMSQADFSRLEFDPAELEGAIWAPPE